MLESLNAFFQGLLNTSPSSHFSHDDTRVLIAALCFQVMEADGSISEAERESLRQNLKEHYGLDEEKLESVLETGLEIESEAVDYYRFTSELKRRLTAEERLELVGVLWDIVYADGVRTEMEDHILWRVADLLGVSDRDRVLSRKGAAARAGQVGETDAS
ncbi:TerB family tellurite resistance protein [Allorhizobium sp. BGMRC 0089]|uniref:tellurite resistance TerB family protein n=1 Tax=Allorhizobium sonneratiae TaxID=2934936 RepID=UPI0020343424|nr:TerB family tellurite resistance protein [Allorhizobium sonneratiae]MCM2293430.1 TerB family tellurite resistance protein [Allorhizobium sonneratiae]